MSAPRQHSVQSGEITIWLRDFAGGQPPVVALHGLASNARWWDLVAANLAPEYRVVALDQRGHGRSSRPAHGYSFADNVADVIAVFDQLDLGPAIIVGHSWGASVALSVAAHNPDRVLGVVCVDGGVADLRRVFGPTWAQAQAAMAPPDLAGLTLAQLRRWVELSSLADASDAATSLDILLGNFEDDGAGGLRPRLEREHHMEIAKHLYHLDVHAVLARVTCPVLLMMAALGSGPAISGEQLLASKRAGVDDAMARLGGRGAVVWIEGEHDLPVQRPEAVAQALAAFVASLPSRT